MKQLIITLICLLMQVVNIHATSEGITWKWDYSDAKDTFIDLTDKYSTGFVETNTPNYYGGKLIVELPEELYFRQTGVPIFLFTGNIDEITFNVNLSDRVATLSLKTPLTQTVPKQAIHIQLNPKAIKGKIKKGMNTTYSLDFHPSKVPTTFTSPITGRSYSLVFNDEFNDGTIDSLKWDTRSNRSPFTRRGMYEGKPYYVLCHDDWTKELDGELRLEVSKYPTQKNVIMTGGILSLGRFMTRYGYYETKASFKDCTGEGYWPAFWIHFDEADQYGEGTEIDVFEYIPKDKQIFHTLHWYEKQAAVKEQQPEIQHAALNYDISKQFNEHRSSTEYFTLEDAQSKEHTFAVEWTPEELIFYTDGKVTRRVNKKDDPKQVPSAYQMVYFSCSAGEWGGNVMKSQEPAYVYFDYCRCYQESDQDAIYTVNGNATKIPASQRTGKL